MNAFYNIRNELFIEDNLLFYNTRLVVPESLRLDMLHLLHQGHFGIEKTRARARSVLFWPGLSTDIESYIKKCSNCAEYQYSNCKEPLKKHEIIMRPWAKIAMDLFTFQGVKYLIIVDYYSRYFEYFKLSRDSTAGSIINCMKEIFSRLGIPEICISDNGPPFDSHKLLNFAQRSGFVLDNSAPLMANSNGLVEKSAAIAKGILRKADNQYLAMLEYRNSPLKHMDKSPNELMFNRNLKSNLPVKSEMLNNIDNKSKSVLVDRFRRAGQLQEKYYNRSANTLSELSVGDSIRYKKHAHSRTWDRAEMIKQIDNRNYVVKNEKGNELIRNRKHLIKTGESGFTAPIFERDTSDQEYQPSTSKIVSSETTDSSLSRIGNQSNCVTDSMPKTCRSLRDRSKIAQPSRLKYNDNFKQIANLQFAIY